MSMVVVIDSGFLANCPGNSPLGGPNFNKPDVDGAIDMYFPSESELCFTIENSSGANGVVTGFELRFGGIKDVKGPFTLLSVEPVPQPGNQDFVFTQVTGQPLDSSNSFAFITGKNIAQGDAAKGVPSGGSSSRFCVGGDFSVLTEEQIIDSVRIRFEALDKSTPRWSAKCFEGQPPETGGVTGLLAGNPR